MGHLPFPPVPLFMANMIQVRQLESNWLCRCLTLVNRPNALSLCFLIQGRGQSSFDFLTYGKVKTATEHNALGMVLDAYDKVVRHFLGYI